MKVLESVSCNGYVALAFFDLSKALGKPRNFFIYLLEFKGTITFKKSSFRKCKVKNWTIKAV